MLLQRVNTGFAANIKIYIALQRDNVLKHFLNNKMMVSFIKETITASTRF